MFLQASAVLAIVASLVSPLVLPETPDITQRETKASASGTFSGEATVYNQFGATGSCGHKHPDSSFIVALSNSWMHNESPAPLCGRKIRATNVNKGNSVTLTVQDTCEGCGETHIDLSIAAWNSLTGDAEFGVVDVKWQFL